MTEKEFAVIKNELESATNDKESTKTNAKENKNKNQHLDKKVLYTQGGGHLKNWWMIIWLNSISYMISAIIYIMQY